MNSSHNKFLVLTLAIGAYAIFLTGCTHLQKCGTPNHLEELQTDQPAILATGTPEQIREAAIADARADIAANRPRVAITGSIAAWPAGVPEEYFDLVQSYPKISLPCGCTSRWLNQATNYAEAYNQEILPYLIRNNELHL